MIYTKNLLNLPAPNWQRFFEGTVWKSLCINNEKYFVFNLL